MALSPSAGARTVTCPVLGVKPCSLEEHFLDRRLDVSSRPLSLTSLQPLAYGRQQSYAERREDEADTEGWSTWFCVSCRLQCPPTTGPSSSSRRVASKRRLAAGRSSGATGRSGNS